jgi:hypothetical protein
MRSYLEEKVPAPVKKGEITAVGIVDLQFFK